MIKFKSSDVTKNMGKITRRVIFIVSITVLAVSLFFIIKYYWESYQNSLVNNSLREIHSTVQVSSKVVSSTVDPTKHGLIELKNKNSDTCGWITIPGTNIDYPVVHSKDNDEYLRINFYKEQNKDGSIFMDYRNSTSPLGTSTIIYGHNMKDGQMFAQLEKYERRSNNDYISFYNKYPLIRFETLTGENVFKIFAVLVTTGNYKYDGALNYINADLSTEKSFNKFISDVAKRSFIKTDIDVKNTDKIITLSTCDYVYPASDDGDHARLVVMGRLLREGESEKITPAVKNTNVTFPDFYYDLWNK